MNKLDFIQTVKIQGKGYLLNRTMSVPNADGNIEYELIKQWLSDGNIPESEFTDEEIELAKEEKTQRELKYAKNSALNSIVVTVNDKTFDGNETARTNMISAILSADLIGKTEETWKLADNTTALVTLTELKQALALAIQEVGRIAKSETIEILQGGN